MFFIRGKSRRNSFNTQPPEGGWRRKLKKWVEQVVSTHSRPKAAGNKLALTRYHL